MFILAYCVYDASVSIIIIGKSVIRKEYKTVSFADGLAPDILCITAENGGFGFVVNTVQMQIGFRDVLRQLLAADLFYKISACIHQIDDI